MKIDSQLDNNTHRKTIANVHRPQVVGESSIQDIVVDTITSLGRFKGRRNSINFGTTPEGIPDNIRLLYGINGCGKTVTLNTVHEIFRKGKRDKTVFLNRIANEGNCEFSLVEDLSNNPRSNENTLREEFEIYLPTDKRAESELERHNQFIMWVVAPHRQLWHQIKLDGLPDEIEAGLRTLGDGRYDWAYLWSGRRMFFERNSKTKLKEMLRKRGLSEDGLKQELVDRLYDLGPVQEEVDWAHGIMNEHQNEILFLDKSAIGCKVNRTVEFRKYEAGNTRPLNSRMKPVFEILGEKVDYEDIFGNLKLVENKRKEVARLSIPANMVLGLAESREITKVALKEKLKKRGKKVSGNKADLQLRFEHCLRSDTAGKMSFMSRTFPGREAVPEYSDWKIEQEYCFPGFDFDESTQLISSILPYSAEQIDSLIASAEEAEDPEEIQLMLTNIEEMKLVRAKFYQIMGPFLPFSMAVDTITWTEGGEQWDELLWTPNGFRVLNEIWEGVPRKWPFDIKQFTNLSSVHLDVDRVSLADGKVPSDRRKEAAHGLESKVEDFWKAYEKVISGYENHYRTIRKVFRIGNRDRRRLGKKKLFIRFDEGSMEWGSPGYIWEEVMGDLQFLETNPVQDKFSLRVEQITESYRNYISDEEDKDALEIYTTEKETESFEAFNRMIYRLIPAMNFLKQAHETTKLILTNPEEDSSPFKRTTLTDYNTGDTEDLEPDDLSSGEKHLFSMLLPIATASMRSTTSTRHYESPQHFLVLIDEPEISLHVNWQASLVDSVESALRANKGEAAAPVSVIFATHSPVILGNHIHRSTCLGPTEVFYEE